MKQKGPCRHCKHFKQIVSVFGRWPFDRVLAFCESPERNNRVIMIADYKTPCEYWEPQDGQ